MKATIDRPWFRAAIDGVEILTWEGWVTFAVVGGVLAALWRATSVLSEFQRFAITGGFLLLAGRLMRFRSVEVAREDTPDREPWTTWAPMATAIALAIPLNLIPHLDESQRLAVTAAAMLPAALVTFVLERREVRL